MMAADGAISPEPKHCRRGDDEGDVASLFGARESFDLKNLLAPAPEPAENLADEFSSSAGRDLIFYCYDVAPNAAEDSVLLFGKVPVRHQQNSSAAFASCCVKLRRLSRVMHAVPRSQDLIAAETKGDRQEFRASAELVSELSAAARRARFPDDDVEISACARNYAFGTACERGSRRVAKIKTHVWTKNFPRDVAGEHFSEIRGTRIGCVERAILKLGLRGPEWLAVPLGKWKILDRNARPATWARLEFEIEDETYVCRYADLADDEATRDRYSKVPEPPPLTSLAIEILCSEGRELAVAGFETETGARFAIANVGRSEALSAILQSSQNSLLPIADRSDVGIFPDEISILSTIAEIFRAHDPDIVVGHKLLATIVPTLRERFRRLGIPPSTWSRLGRINFSRSEFGSGDGKNHHPTSDSLRILQGRIACDTFIAAREHIKCASHELSELARTTVKVQQTFCEFSESEILRMLTDAPLGQNLERLVCRAVLGAQTSARVAEKIDLVPRLASKLAAASGYTMTGCIAEGRSRRVGYALAHAFHERNFILPEPKFFGPESENLDDAPAKTSKKKGARAPAYEGGLVLEPKIGLHEECIALLDYKSMYPSIICANDICYTTFQNSSDEKNSEKKTKMRGVLPAVVSDLVKARRRVKEKMKTEASPSRRAEQDAEQLALKIMVNSIYGSLGFGRSPWSFRPMAELVTRLGRETLARTTAAITAEFPGLEIVAGDTDSAMVALKISDIKIARELGLRIADFVNSTRTSSAMEIELADVFERAAFFGKKKYAALSTMTPERTVVRGLDLVRRDWCGLVRKISIQVLARILRSESANFAKLENFAGDDTPTAVACRLCEAAFSDVKKLDPADDLAITKELKKPLGAYARGGGKNLQHSSSATGYHVEAARALVAAGIRVDVGDAISYIVCKTAEGADLARLAVPVRLHDPKVSLLCKLHNFPRLP